MRVLTRWEPQSLWTKRRRCQPLRSNSSLRQMLCYINSYILTLLVTPLRYVRDFTQIVQTESKQLKLEARISRVVNILIG